MLSSMQPAVSVVKAGGDGGAGGGDVGRSGAVGGSIGAGGSTRTYLIPPSTISDGGGDVTQHTAKALSIFCSSFFVLPPFGLNDIVLEGVGGLSKGGGGGKVSAGGGAK